MTHPAERRGELGALPAPPRGLAEGPLADRLDFERLEYGKLCLEADGPIRPGSEAYPLVASPGFPPALRALCHPATLGVGADLPAGISEGWVVRAVRHPGGVLPVACRLRRRPEDGEGGRERAYWLGRYVCCPTAEADPLTCFEALRAQPTRGITADETRRPWAALPIERAPRPKIGAIPRAFLREAVVYAVSAIPVGLAPRLPAERFFEWATALWALLPPGLRPAFGAGWGVASSQSAALSLSYSPAYPSTVALFDAEQGRWRPPAERVLLGEDGREEPPQPWRDRDLTSGRMYLREAFAWGEDGQPLFERGAQVDFLAGLLAGSETGPGAAGTPQVVDLRARPTAELFKRPGLAALDHARLQVLKAWLADPAAPEPAGLCPATTDYFTPGARRQVLASGVAAFARGNRHGDRVLWASLEEDPQAAAELGRLADNPPEIQERVRLLAALSRREAGGALAALAAAPAAADDLPPAAAQRLAECLAQSLERDDLMERHAAILEGAPVPEDYRRWAARETEALAFALARRPGRSRALRALAGLAQAPFAACIAAWREGMRPDREECASALAGLPEELRTRLSEQLVRDWDEPSPPVAERREALLPWLRRLPPGEAVDDPLLRIWLKGPAVEIRSTPALAKAIEEGQVPPTLASWVSAAVLRRWAYFADLHDGRPERWRPLFAFWPADVRTALLGDGGGPEGERLVEIEAALDRFSLPSARLELCLSHLERLAEVASKRRVGRLVWDWCSRAEGASFYRAPDLCRAMAAGTLPEGGSPREEDRRAAAALARSAGVFAGDPRLLHQLWSRARVSWQILLLLESAPEADLDPDYAQLAALVPWRLELARHLGLPDLHKMRRKRFQVASHDFHTQEYRPNLGNWQAYKHSILWAAFAGVPFDKQGDLGDALDRYAEGDPFFNQKRVELARRYLSTYRNDRPRDRKEAAKRVAHGLVLPLAKACEVSPAELASAIGRLFGQAPQRTGIVQPPLLETNDEINALKRTGRDLAIARWFKSFLLEVRDWADGEALLAAIRKGGSA